MLDPHPSAIISMSDIFVEKGSLQTSMQVSKWFVNDAIRKFNYLKGIVVLKLNSYELKTILICTQKVWLDSKRKPRCEVLLFFFTKGKDLSI